LSDDSNFAIPKSGERVIHREFKGVPETFTLYLVEEFGIAKRFLAAKSL
jgi:hypothetical protein